MAVNPMLIIKPMATATIPAPVRYVRCSTKLTRPNINTVYININSHPAAILTPSKNMALELISLKLLATLTRIDMFGILASKSSNVLMSSFSQFRVVGSANSSSTPSPPESFSERSDALIDPTQTCRADFAEII